MRLEVDVLLRAVELAKPLLEEGVGDVVVLGLAHGDALRRLVVAKRARLGHNADVSGRVHLLEHHLELVEKSERLTTLSVHNLLNSLAVELDVEAPERGLQLLKVHHEVASRIPSSVITTEKNLLCRKAVEVGLLVELVKQFSKKITAREVLLKIIDFLQHRLHISFFKKEEQRVTQAVTSD